VGAARLVVDQRHLTEEIPVAQHREDDLAPVLADEHHLHLAGRNDVQRVSRVVLEENHAVLGILALPGDLAETGQVGLREVGEERHPLEHVGRGHGSGPGMG